MWRRAAAERVEAAANAAAASTAKEGDGSPPVPPPPPPRPPFKRAIIFVDNAGADVVLGILPLARELLAWGCDVVLAANAAPAINDVTERELRAVVAEAAGFSAGSRPYCCCPLLAAAAAAGDAAEAAAGGRIPPVPGLRARVPSVGSRLFDLGGGGDGGAVAAPRPASSTSPTPPPLAPSPPPPFPLARSPDASPPASPDSRCAASASAASTPLVLPGVGRLFVCSNGQGSPCLDLRRVPGALADACVGADLVVVEGMGRAIHTNFRARFRVSSLKLAMIKNAHLAEALLGGEIMDCVCLFEGGVAE